MSRVCKDDFLAVWRPKPMRNCWWTSASWWALYLEVLANVETIPARLWLRLYGVLRMGRYGAIVQLGNSVYGYGVFLPSQVCLFSAGAYRIIVVRH